MFAGSFTEGAFRTQNTQAEISVFDVFRENQSDEFKEKRYSVILHQVAVTSVTDGLIGSLDSLRFPVVAAQSKNKCALRFLYLFGGTRRKSSVKDFLKKDICGSFAFSEVVSDKLDLLQETPEGLMDPELQVRLLAEIEEGVHHFIFIFPPCSTFSRAGMANRMGPPANSE